MKIKTLEKLQDLLDKDFSWRKKELIEIKLHIHAFQSPVYVRAGIALLCAHFEGFIKQSANYYVVFVSNQNIGISALHENFAAIQFSKKLKSCAETEKISAHSEFLDLFINGYNSSSFKVKYTDENPPIKTDANPSSKVLEEITHSIGLDFTRYETKRNYIDSDLLSNRHKIVHGQKTYISPDDFDQTFEKILDIMDSFKQQIMDAAINKDYLKVPIV